MPLRTTGIIVDKTGCRHLTRGGGQLLYGEMLEVESGAVALQADC
jgi:hypothetical protein